MERADEIDFNGSSPSLLDAVGNPDLSTFKELQFPHEIPDWPSDEDFTQGFSKDHPGNGFVHSHRQVIDLENTEDHEIIDLDNYPSESEAKKTAIKKEEDKVDILVSSWVNNASNFKEEDDDVIYISTNTRPIQIIDLLDSDDEKAFTKGGPTSPRVKLENAGSNPRPIKEERVMTSNVDISNVVHASQHDDNASQTEQQTHSRGNEINGSEISGDSQLYPPVSNVNVGRSILSTRREHVPAFESTRKVFGDAPYDRRAQPPNACAHACSGSAVNKDDGSENFGQIIRDDNSKENSYEAIRARYLQNMKNTQKDDAIFRAAYDLEMSRPIGPQGNFDGSRGVPQNPKGHEMEEDDSLFIQEDPSPRLKRTHAAIELHDATSEDDLQEIDAANVHVNDRMPKRKRIKSQPMSKQIAEQIKEQNLEANIRAGLESVLGRQTRAEPDLWKRKAKKKAAKRAQRQPKSTRSEPKKKGKASKRNRNGTSLVTVDVLGEANASHDQPGLGSSTEQDNRKNISALKRSVPRDNRPGVRDEWTRLLKASASFGPRKVQCSDNPADAGRWVFKGMRSSLLHHQMLGASFMRNREIGDEAPFGGLLADEMGFGKTIMMIATMITNRPEPTESSKSTLIVCSPAIMHQWKREIDKHTQPKTFEALKYYRDSRFEGDEDYVVHLLEQTDIVLTTYGEVMRSYPRTEPPEDLHTETEKSQWWQDHFNQHRGVLHKANFYRVVLDEAQVIKNHKARTSISCQALMATHRWAISGTPIQNMVEELYPYFKFLRVKHTGTINDFRKNFCGKDDSLCMDRLHFYLQPIMLRRTHVDLIFGAAIIKLPKTHQKSILLDANPVETMIYRAVELRYITAINRFAKTASDDEIKRIVLVMILRLRQMTAHIFLVQNIIEDIFELEDVEGLCRLTQNEASASGGESEREMAAAIHRMIQAKDEDLETSEDECSDNAGEGEPVESPTDQTQTNESQNPQHLSSKFRKLLRTLIERSESSEFAKRSICPKCKGPPDAPWVTDCYHVYCRECLLAVALEAGDRSEDGAKCLECGTIFRESKPCEGVKELREGILEPQMTTTKRHKPPKNPLKWIDMGGHLLQSTKSAAVHLQLEQWLRQEPDKKIIVFSQWHMMMDIIVRNCEDAGWGFCRYHGKMSHAARDQAIAAFESDPTKKILVASLKCGGIGLNLTMASRVVCVDLWFNSCLEQQAYCRVVRIGQESETHVVRFLLRRTIDERLAEMQERKKAVVGKALGDTHAFRKFTAEDLMRLFGTVKKGEDGRPFVVVDVGMGVGGGSGSVNSSGATEGGGNEVANDGGVVDDGDEEEEEANVDDENGDGDGDDAEV